MLVATAAKMIVAEQAARVERRLAAILVLFGAGPSAAAGT
jgi:hypothetical protein